jgi:hypothetical protein
MRVTRFLRGYIAIHVSTVLFFVYIITQKIVFISS